MLVIDSRRVEKSMSSVMCGLSSVDGGIMPYLWMLPFDDLFSQGHH